MFSSIWDDTRRVFERNDMVTKLIVINCAVFVILNLIRIFLVPIEGGIGSSENFNSLMNWLMVPSEPSKLITRPWTIFTYMFMHLDFWHILGNMLFLYYFGMILRQFVSNERILPIYILGGLMGFVFFFLGATILPDSYSNFIGGRMLGASAGVMAIVTATATMTPNYSMNLILIGPVKLKYLAAVIIFLDIISFANGANAGGMIAHFGGVLMGYLIIEQMRKGNDLPVKFNNIVDKVTTFFMSPFKSEGKQPKVVYKNPERKTKAKVQPTRRKAQRPNHQSGSTKQEQVDAILDKIKMSGYDSLTKEEKEFLFKASKDD